MKISSVGLTESCHYEQHRTKITPHVISLRNWSVVLPSWQWELLTWISKLAASVEVIGTPLDADAMLLHTLGARRLSFFFEFALPVGLCIGFSTAKYLTSFHTTSKSILHKLFQKFRHKKIKNNKNEKLKYLAEKCYQANFTICRLLLYTVLTKILESNSVNWAWRVYWQQRCYDASCTVPRVVRETSKLSGNHDCEAAWSLQFRSAVSLYSWEK